MAASSFDVPLNVDPATGEILDDEPQQAIVEAPRDGEHGPLTARTLASAFLVKGEALAQLRETLLQGVRTLADNARMDRPAGPVTDSSVRPELVAMTKASENLKAAASALTDAAKEADYRSGQLLLEAREERANEIEAKGGSTSLRYGFDGREFKVGVTQATETWTDAAAILDVLVNEIVAVADTAEEATLLAQGARRMAAALLGGVGRDGVLGAPSYKITVLEALRVRLEAAGEAGLATQLAGAFGKRPKGDPRVTVSEEIPRTR